MKPFNLESALAGHPVKTRDGRPVTQLVEFELSDNTYTVVGVLDGADIRLWMKDGRFINSCYESPADLFMEPVKKTGWVARYSDGMTSRWVIETEEAIRDAHPDAAAYHEISWEE